MRDIQKQWIKAKNLGTKLQHRPTDTLGNFDHPETSNGLPESIIGKYKPLRGASPRNSATETTGSLFHTGRLMTPLWPI